MSIGKNVHRIRLERKLTLDQVASVVGVSRQTVQKYESGVIANIPQEKVERLARALAVSPAALMGWEEPISDVYSIDSVMKIHHQKVPLLGDVAAGQPIFASECREDYVMCADSVHCDFALRVKGDSMMPLLHNGDTVFVREQADVLDGEIAVVLIEDSATLKHVYHLPNQSGIQLVAENPSYSPMVLTGEACEGIRILGLAVSYQRKLGNYLTR